MAETTVTIRLKQQQKDLLERTVAAGVAPDRIALIRNIGAMRLMI